MDKSVSLKGTNEGYLLILDEEESIKNIFIELEILLEQLKKEKKTEKKFDLLINTGNRIFSDTNKEKITKLISKETNFIVKQFNEEVIQKKIAEKWREETTPKMIVKNIRNGQIVQSNQDIILFGDVRPGGVVRSKGNIIIIGKVQGLVHAGVDGNEEAIIIAPFSFDGQVRISEHVEIIGTEEKELNVNSKNKYLDYQIVFLNDLHTIEFDLASKLADIRPDFAKDLGGLNEWQKRL